MAVCTQVLFWGMSIHWVSLLWDGMTQKMWLRLQGFRKPKKPTEVTSGDGGAAALV